MHLPAGARLQFPGLRAYESIDTTSILALCPWARASLSSHVCPASNLRRTGLTGSAFWGTQFAARHAVCHKCPFKGRADDEPTLTGSQQSGRHLLVSASHRSGRSSADRSSGRCFRLVCPRCQVHPYGLGDRLGPHLAHKLNQSVSGKELQGAGNVRLSSAGQLHQLAHARRVLAQQNGQKLESLPRQSSEQGAAGRCEAFRSPRATARISSRSSLSDLRAIVVLLCL